MKTRDRIVQCALALFNEQGERHITTNHIANHLDISPGNLYYHFPNKQAIINEIFTIYAKELLTQFTPKKHQQDSLMMFKSYLDAIFNLMWKYRFFYANLPQILQQDDQLHQQYIEVQRQTKRNLRDIFSTFIEMNLVEIKQQELDTVITSLHMIISCWLSYQSSISLTSDITESVIRQGIQQLTAMLIPFATEQGKQQLTQLEITIKQYHST